MSSFSLVARGLAYYWRTNIAVVIGVATAVAVLAGALLVGDSVRGSLRDLVLQQLGRTDLVVVSSGFFRETVSERLQVTPAFKARFESVSPLIVAQGVVSEQASGRLASRVQVYAVDERFWSFHRRGQAAPQLDERDALVSEALAARIGATSGTTVVVRVERPSAVPIESLHGRRDDRGRSLRLTVRSALGPADLGAFSLRPQQGRVQAVFVPLRRLQQELGLDGRVNTLLVSERSRPHEDTLQSLSGGPNPAPSLEEIVRATATLEDVGVTVRAVGDGVLAVESDSGILDGPRAAAAERAAVATSMKAQPVFTYLANSLRSGQREVPYSLVTATDLRALVAQSVRRGTQSAQVRDDLLAAADATSVSPPPIVLNEWAARDLAVRPGDPLALDYYVWQEPGHLLTRTADFRIAAVVPIAGAAADRKLAPVYPGITESDTLADWDPPFPIDLRKVRRVDEDYWRDYRTTPKAFVPIEVGQRLWSTRYGDRTSMRISPPAGEATEAAVERYTDALHAAADPLTLGLAVRDVRADGLTASRGATDFGEYFTYFSFFLVVSALLLAALFFRLGVEQRAREVGLLRAVGYTTGRIRRLFVTEGLLLSVTGGVLGAAGAVGYARLMMTGLGSWWSGAVGTDALQLHVSLTSLVAGASGAVITAVACIWWTMRGLARLSERSLLAGQVAGDDTALLMQQRRYRSRLFWAVGFSVFAVILLVASATEAVDRTGAFFGAGTSLLLACLCLLAFTLRKPGHRRIDGQGWRSVSRLGTRNAAVRPGRSVLAVAVIAAATFILISVDAFRRPPPTAADRHSGVGGYSLLVELLVPMADDPNGAEGRDKLGLSGSDRVAIDPFRLRPGDDASCLNLYQPRNPRILGAGSNFIQSGRFAFQSSLAADDRERRNPWLLLKRTLDTGDGTVIPIIADANSITYVLHKRLGDDVVVQGTHGPVRLRLVAALADSIFQSELVMSEQNFRRVFPDQNGFRYLLAETEPDRTAAVQQALEEGGRDIGSEVSSTTTRLAEFHRVENTYISTFQTLGGLGLLVGTIGLAAILLRNTLERRRDLALLGAVGYRRAHVFAIVLAENVLLLGWGLAIGVLCALIAVIPAAAERGARTPTGAGGWLLLAAVFIAGLLSSALATRTALKTPLLAALRAE